MLFEISDKTQRKFIHGGNFQRGTTNHCFPFLDEELNCVCSSSDNICFYKYKICRRTVVKPLKDVCYCSFFFFFLIETEKMETENARTQVLTCATLSIIFLYTTIDLIYHSKKSIISRDNLDVNEIKDSIVTFCKIHFHLDLKLFFLKYCYKLRYVILGSSLSIRNLKREYNKPLQIVFQIFQHGSPPKILK